MNEQDTLYPQANEQDFRDMINYMCGRIETLAAQLAARTAERDEARRVAKRAVAYVVRNGVRYWHCHECQSMAAELSDLKHPEGCVCAIVESWPLD